MIQLRLPGMRGRRAARVAPGGLPGKRETSREAAELVPMSHREIVLCLFQGAGARGLTSDQVASVTGWDRCQVCPRIAELQASGKIVETNRRRETRMRRRAIVYVLASCKGGVEHDLGNH